MATDKDQPIFRKERMAGKTWLEGEQTLYNMGAELEQYVDGFDGRIDTAQQTADSAVAKANENATNIAKNTADIATNKNDIATNKADIATNKSDIASIKEKNEQQDSSIQQNATDIDTIENRISGLESGDIATMKTEITAIQEKNTAQDSSISANASAISAIQQVDAQQTEQISGHTQDITDINANLASLAEELPSDIVLYRPSDGKIQLQYQKENAESIESNILDMKIPTQIDMISGTTDRSFKLRIHWSDGTQDDTNDFVIPEGGGTEVVVTSVTLQKNASDANKFKVSIGLSDGSPIESSEIEMVTAVSGTYADKALTFTVNGKSSLAISLSDVLTTADAGMEYMSMDYNPSALTATFDGTNLNVTLKRSIGDLSTGNIPINVDVPLYELPVATAETLGGIKRGSGINIAPDGTASVNIPEPVETVEVNTDGTIQVNDIKSTNKVALPSEIEDIQDQIGALGVTASSSGNTMTIGVNGKSANATIVNNASLSLSGNNLTLNVNGVTSTIELNIKSNELNGVLTIPTSTNLQGVTGILLNGDGSILSSTNSYTGTVVNADLNSESPKYNFVETNNLKIETEAINKISYLTNNYTGYNAIVRLRYPEGMLFNGSGSGTIVLKNMALANAYENKNTKETIAIFGKTSDLEYLIGDIKIGIENGSFSTLTFTVEDIAGNSKNSRLNYYLFGATDKTSFTIL